MNISVPHNRFSAMHLRRACGRLLALVIALTCAAGAYAAPFAYVTNLMPASVSVIDTTTNQVSATIVFPAGSQPNGAALTPDLKKLYVSGNNSLVYVVDTATNALAANPITVAGLPDGIAITPDGRHAYVACAYGSAVSVIDTASDTVSATIAFPSGTNLTNIAITPDGQRAYVAAEGASAVYVLDTATNTILGAPITVAGHPQGLAVTPDGKQVYLTHNDAAAAVSVIDVAANTVVATFPGSYVFAVAITPDGKLAYATGGGGNGYTLVIDTATQVLLQTLQIGGAGIAISADGQHAYLPQLAALAVIDTATNQQSASISGPVHAQNVAVRPLPPGIAVPDLVGNTQAAASSTLIAASLAVGTITPQASSTVPIGSVISQTPAAGVLVGVSAAVGLVLSSGVAVPSVVGTTQSAATTTLTGAGLKVGTVTSQVSNTVADGSVIGQSPAAGTGVPAGSAVDLVISLGAEPDPISPPAGGGGGSLDGLALAALAGALLARRRRLSRP